MPKYLVNHTLLGPGPVDTKPGDAQIANAERILFKPDTIVGEGELAAAGFDLDRLRTPKEGGFSPAIILQRGSENDGDTAAAYQNANASDQGAGAAKAK